MKTKISNLAAQLLAKHWYLGFSCFDEESARRAAADFVTCSKLGDCFELDEEDLYMRIEQDGIYLCEGNLA